MYFPPKNSFYNLLLLLLIFFFAIGMAWHCNSNNFWDKIQSLSYDNSWDMLYFWITNTMCKSYQKFSYKCIAMNYYGGTLLKPQKGLN